MYLDQPPRRNSEITWPFSPKLPLPQLLGSARFFEQSLHPGGVLIGDSALLTACLKFLGKEQRRAAIYCDGTSTHRLQFEKLNTPESVLVQLKENETRARPLIVEASEIRCGKVEARYYAGLVERALTKGQAILTSPELPLVESIFSSRFLPTLAPLSSRTVTVECICDAHKLIRSIFKSDDDINDACETYSAFVEQRALRRAGETRPYYKLIDYRIFSNGEKDVGVGGLYTYPGFECQAYFLGWLGIDPSERGKGYGLSLVTGLEELAKQLRGKVIYVHTPRDLEEYASARRMYRVLGYHVEPYLTFNDEIYLDQNVEVVLAKRLPVQRVQQR